jgi:hypothetical protein
MSKNRKSRLLVKVKDPFFIHKEVNGTDMTFMIGYYALPWRAITNVPLCDAVVKKVEKLKKAFPDAHIDFNFNRENPAFLFRVVGKTKRCITDEHNADVGEVVARAKAMSQACVISKAIIREAMKGLEEELNRSFIIFKDWQEKERRIIKGV